MLHQGSPAEIVSLLQSGEADIGIATEALERAARARHSSPSRSTNGITPSSCPTATRSRRPALTLDALAEYPLITYHEGFTGRPRIDATFAAAGLVPDIVMSALDADVIKTYVEVGLGVGIVASMAFDAARDTA